MTPSSTPIGGPATRSMSGATTAISISTRMNTTADAIMMTVAARPLEPTAARDRRA
jgi:hypothetical protein